MRFPLLHGRRLVFALGLCLASLTAAAADATPTGAWPQPYTKVSAKSIEWLKAKQWWPLTIAWQPAFAGQNATMFTMASNDLLGRRGVQTKFDPVANGGLVNKAIVAGTAQVGSAGNFPLTTLVDAGAPIRVIAITAPNLRHHVIVPKDSPIKKMSDFKGMRPPAQIGLVLGTSAEFYFQATAAANGMRVGSDVILKNTPQPEQATMPKELAAVVPWDPTATLITNELKTGRAIDVSYPYNVYQGSVYIRKELVDEVPDVAQAIAEAYVEADLLIRMAPEKTAEAMAASPDLKAFSRELLLVQIREYNLLYKPTYLYPLGRFFGLQNQDVAMWLHLQGKLKKPLVREDYEAFFAPGPMDKVFATLGWKVPVVPPYVDTEWTSAASRRLTLPPYATFLSMKAPQPWPEREDLTKPFRFGDKTYTP
jgi:ABC-type nitrate/sulfonate/bicarbonate transport system substrate-binding protein